MTLLTLFGVGAVGMMLLAYTLETRSHWWILLFALTCAASSLYGWLSGTWPFGIVEGIWAVVALRRWWQARRRQSTFSIDVADQERSLQEHGSEEHAPFPS